MGTIRDFKEETVIVMCENVDGDPGTFFGADGVGDWFHDILHWGRPNLYDKAGETKKYFKFVLEQNDIYAEKLRSILNNVWECEEYYNSQFTDVSDQLAEYNRMIETLVGQIEPKTFILDFNKWTSILAVLGIDPEDYQAIIDYLRSKGATQVESIDSIADISQLMNDIENYNRNNPDDQVSLPDIPGVTEAVDEYRDHIASVGDPLQGDWGRVSARYGSIDSAHSTPHSGMDITAAEGTPIVSVWYATVVSTGTDGSRGNYIILNMTGEDGHIYRIEIYHMYRKSPLSAGDSVVPGTYLGGVGTTGNSTGNHLHIGVYDETEGKRKDPADYLGDDFK